MPEHILFVLNSYPPRTGGLEKHVENLGKSLISKGHKVSVITIDSKFSSELHQEIPVIRIPGILNIGSVISFPPIGTRRVIQKMIREKGITAVSVHTRFFPMTWLGVAASRRAKVKSILTEHGSNFVSGVNPFVSIASKFTDYSLGRKALKTATKVLAISDESARFVKKLSGRDAVVFNNAIQTNYWSTQVQPRRHNLVFIGRLVPGKGAIEAVKVFEQVAEFFPNTQLHIFGDGSERLKLDQLIKTSIHSKNIFVHGMQTPEVIREHLSGAVFINPTTLSEGFQTTLLEAVACGARVVTFPVPGLQLLSDSGALVFQAEDLSGLVAQTKLAFATHPKKIPSMKLKKWDWSCRAIEYSEIISDKTK